MKIKEKDISLLCKITREIFMEQPVFLELEAPIKICGKLLDVISHVSQPRNAYILMNLNNTDYQATLTDNSLIC